MGLDLEINVNRPTVHPVFIAAVFFHWRTGDIGEWQMGEVMWVLRGPCQLWLCVLPSWQGMQNKQVYKVRDAGTAAAEHPPPIGI